MHATDVHIFADIAHLRLEKDRAMDLIRSTGQFSDGAMQNCITYHREVLRRMQGKDDPALLERQHGALRKDVEQLNVLRETLMQHAAQDRDPAAIEKIRLFLGALERLMRTMHRILEYEKSQQWAYLDKRNPAMPKDKQSIKNKNDNTGKEPNKKDKDGNSTSS